MKETANRWAKPPRRTALFIALASCVAGLACDRDSLTPGEHQVELESFDLIWSTLRDCYFDPTFGGMDWDAVRTELRPRIEQVSCRENARQVLEELATRLGDSHVTLIPRELCATKGGGTREADPGATGVVGRAIDGRADP